MKFASFSKIAVPLGVVGIIMLLVVPIPAALLDGLIAVSILLALVILLTTMFAKRPLDFSVFPSLLLVATLLRLGLNVASTRLVLGNGYAGEVIAAFGHIAVGGSLIIGCVIFLILVVIQFVVVTKGAERVAEVGARFTLDAMPGKQMAIDADLNAGPDHRLAGTRAPRGGRRGGRLLRRHGRRVQVRQGRRDRRRHHHHHQPGRRHRDRHGAARHGHRARR